jgi:predicted metal-dependent RNase
MNIQAEKIEIMKLILETDNPSILESIKGLFNRNKTVDFWETLSQDQKDDIVQGINEIENGEVVDYDNFMKKHR